MFGGNSASLTAALAYVKANGGGTLAVSSQSTAAAAIIASDADVAGIGGFSGRESAVTTAWLADAGAPTGKIRWVLGRRRRRRRAAQRRPHRLDRPRWPPSSPPASQVDADGVTLYDCAGQAAAIAAAG